MKNKKILSNGMITALVTIISLVLVFAITLSVFLIVDKPFGETEDEKKEGEVKADYPFRKTIDFTLPSVPENSATISAGDINSEKALVLNATDSVVLASRQGSQLIYPASMTKVMTLIVVFENLKNEDSLKEVITISEEVQMQMESAGSSGFGLKAGEKLTVEDLIYVMILQSDNIACVTLAEYIAGSEAEFVKLMNAKVREMGLLEGDSEKSPSTLFRNSHGLHHQYHYSTCYDMASIMAYAMKNTFCANVLTSLKYKPSDNFRPNDGITFYNAFLVHGVSEGKISPDNAKFIAGKTGYTEEAGSCLVSVAKGKDGKQYIVVTSHAPTTQARLDDQLFLYNTYVK